MRMFRLRGLERVRKITIEGKRQRERYTERETERERQRERHTHTHTHTHTQRERERERGESWGGQKKRGRGNEKDRRERAQACNLSVILSKNVSKNADLHQGRPNYTSLTPNPILLHRLNQPFFLLSSSSSSSLPPNKLSSSSSSSSSSSFSSRTRRPLSSAHPETRCLRGGWVTGTPDRQAHLECRVCSCSLF